MKKPHHPRIRELLRQHPDGLTISAIQHTLCISKASTVRDCLQNMPDVYVDRWTKHTDSRGQYLAIYCLYPPPPNCPYPTERFSRPHTQWRMGSTLQ